MNYFPFHVGDYVASTAHLSWDEDMAYTRLIRSYYQTEKPIPKDKAYRFARAVTVAQKKAVDQVLNEFFVLEDDGHHQKRCDDEIAKFAQKQSKEPVKKENERERQNRARARRKALFSELSSHGITAPWDATTDALQEALSRCKDAPVTPPVTRDNTATQEPRTNNQEPITKIEDTGIQTPMPRAALVCVVVKKAGIGIVNPQHADLEPLLDRGATVQDFEDAAHIAVANGKGFAYCIGIVKGRLIDAERGRKSGAQVESFKERDARIGRERWEQMTGKVHPDNVPKQPSNVIDITPQFLEIAQ